VEEATGERERRIEVWTKDPNKKRVLGIFVSSTA
jgi:hypothetical protein